MKIRILNGKISPFASDKTAFYRSIQNRTIKKGAFQINENHLFSILSSSYCEDFKNAS